MMFVLGLLVGLLLAAVLILAVIAFRPQIERTVKAVQTEVKVRMPAQRGFIVEPDDEATVARQDIIRRNQLQGKDTPLTDL